MNELKHFSDVHVRYMLSPVRLSSGLSSQEVVTLESIFLLVESSTCGMAYLILSVLLV